MNKLIFLKKHKKKLHNIDSLFLLLFRFIETRLTVIVAVLCTRYLDVHFLHIFCYFGLGWILIDRSGKHFGSILCYLRDDTVTLPKGRQAVQELLAEAKYYLVQGLVELCQNTLQVSHIHSV